MKKRQPAVFYFRLAMAALALLLPITSLIVFGSVWLWQNGYVLYWAISACCVTVITYSLERWLFRVDMRDTAPTAVANASELADPGWSARENEAWKAVVDLSQSVRPAEISSRDKAFDLGVRTVETVAKSMHPDEDRALWKFTLPEALALTERVSSQLSQFVIENIPLGDRMTIGQFLRIYRWRSAFEIAEQAYDLWRIIRLINPAAAATQELREQLTRRAYEWGREELAKRITEAYVREVGKAAIDLYSGRMRIAKMAGNSVPAAATGHSAAHSNTTAEPLRILFAGLADRGNEDVVNLLSQGLQQRPVGNEGEDDLEARVCVLAESVPALLIVSPGLNLEMAQSNALIEATQQSDIFVWVTRATALNRPLERQILATIRSHIEGRNHRLPPAFSCVILGVGRSETAESLRLSVAHDLAFETAEVVLLSDANHSDGNIAAIRTHLVGLIPHASRSKMLRIVEKTNGGIKWSRLWTQLRNAGRRTWSGGTG